jgi:hypothetical protein
MALYNGNMQDIRVGAEAEAWKQFCEDQRFAQEQDEIEHEHFCGACGQTYQWCADDISWKYEASPSLSCGCPWEFLDRYLPKQGEACE